MAKHPPKYKLATIPAPQKVQVLEAKPDGVLLQWEHPGGKDTFFIIMWARDDVFYIIDEMVGPPVREGVYQFREQLPTSGTSRYQVLAFCTNPDAKSEPSNAVSVTIQGPAAGDL